MVALGTERLILRPFREADFEQYAGMCALEGDRPRGSDSGALCRPLSEALTGGVRFVRDKSSAGCLND